VHREGDCGRFALTNKASPIADVGHRQFGFGYRKRFHADRGSERPERGIYYRNRVRTAWRAGIVRAVTVKLQALRPVRVALKADVKGEIQSDDSFVAFRLC
jgi:hypothetical protein